VRKAIVLLLAVMLMAALGVAQVDPMLGDHNVNSAGCQACHAPHNALPGQGAYLWAFAIPTGTYHTYLTSDGNGGTMNAGQMTAGLTNAMSSPVANLPMAHTVLCLSCHDTSFNLAMATGIPGSQVATRNYNIGASENLTGDHPVDIIYPLTNPTYWRATVNATNMTVSFTDTTYAYGHPARLFTDGTNAYVECTTCHNPHNQTQTVVPNQTGVLQAVNTTHYVRGQYRATNEQIAPTYVSTNTPAQYTVDNANFCMSCHSYPSNGFNGNVH